MQRVDMNSTLHHWKTSIYLLALLLIASCAAPQPMTTLPMTANRAAPPITAPAPTGTPAPIVTVQATVGIPGYTKITLEIERAGRKYSVLLGYDIGEAWFYQTPAPDYDLSLLGEDAMNITFANLAWHSDVDLDGEREYFLTVSGRGAYPVYGLLAVDYDPVVDGYRVFDTVYFRAPCFDRWEDLEQDGIPEILAKDEEFHYAVGGGGADSVFSPLLILRYNGQKFAHVTHEYTDRLDVDAQHWLESIENDANGQGQFATIYAAYLADMYRLGKLDEIKQVYQEACERKLLPFYKGIDPESTFSCDEYFNSVEKEIKARYE